MRKLLLVSVALLIGCDTRAIFGFPGDVDGGPTDAGSDGGMIERDAGNDAGDDAGMCACESDADCDDGTFCNGEETCDACACVPGTAPTCDDGAACTDDSCDTDADACANVPDDLSCEDTLACTGAASCDPDDATADAEGCVFAAGPDCADTVPCTVDLCTEPAGACTHTPDDSLCNTAAGEVCDVLDGCEVPPSCTTDAECDDNRVCNGVETCVAGTCSNGTPDCADAIDCTADTCDPTLAGGMGACVHEPNHMSCSDLMACTGVEQCDATAGCTNPPDVACDDGFACTTDMCVEPGGTCSNMGTDADMDGHVVVGCLTGDDCDDTNMNIHPGITETCNGIDDDCSGMPDDTGGLSCVMGSGPIACTTGCSTSGMAACVACVRQPCVAPEECNACDDDADGMIDDDFLCGAGLTTPCTTACGSPGTQTCSIDCTSQTTCLGDEVCNGCDDDGDAACDNGFACCQGQTTACNVGGCAGTQMCSSSCTLPACNIGTAPSNDTCAGATMINASMTLPFRTCAGTDNDMAACGGAGAPDVVYQLVIGTRSGVTVRTTGANFDVVAYLRSGMPCPGTGAPIACDDDSGGGTNAAFSRALDPGTYWLVLDGQAAGELGTGMLEVSITAIPANDACASATMVPATGGMFMGSTSGAGNDNVNVACGEDGGGDVWYTINVAVRSVIYAFVDGTSDHSLHLRAGCGGAQAAGGCNTDSNCGMGNGQDPQLVTVVDPGTYALAVDSAAGAEGVFSLRVIISPAGADTPLGDGRRLSVPMTVASTPWQLTDTSDSEPSDTDCPFFINWPGAADHTWFLGACPGDTRSVTINTCDGDFGDTPMMLYVRPNALTATDITCNAESCSPPAPPPVPYRPDAQITFSATGDAMGGTLYLVVADLGANGGFSIAGSEYSLNVTSP